MEYNMMQQSDDDLDGLNNNGNSGYNSNDSANGSSSRMSNDNSGMSKAELRKSNKPIMEKRRRARINHCLNELKTLILEAMKKDPSRHTKLEKADILEMTVKHLQSIQRQQLSMAIQTDPTVIHKFKTGFVECADEVNRYVSQLDNVDAGVRQRLSNHLNNCATGLDQIGTFSNFSSSYRAANSVFGSPITNQTATMFPGATLPHHDVNNNNNNNNNTANRVQMGGVQLIPQRLPSGELALIMPNINTAASVPFFLPTMQTIQTMPPAHQSGDFSTMFPRASAFSKPVSQCANPLIRPNATKNSRTSNASPPLSPVSSASSLGDDSSLMHTSSDFQSKTPPLNIHQSFSSGEFPTPPSAESTTYVKQTSSHLQQQQVTSTSEYRQQMPNKLSISPTVLLKRSLPDHFSDSSDEPSAKKFFGCESGDDNNGNSSTWRPW